MKATWKAIPLTICAAALLALPGAASARSDQFTISASREAEFKLGASNGYRVEVDSVAQQGTDLFATKGKVEATYEVKGGLTSDNGIDAKLPGVGEITVKFKPSGPPRELPPDRNCKGRSDLIRAGVFRGTIEFEGEGGFTKVETGSARGTVFESFKQVCKIGSSGKELSDSQLTLLDATNDHESEDLVVSASTFVSHSKPKFAIASIEANLSSQRHGMTVNRSVSSLGHLNLLKLTGPGGSLQSALVTPPPPFTGTGSFQLTSKTSATWTGTLSVEFPGTGPVSLAGPQFSPSLCVEFHCVPKVAASR
jgi:hypothetical protein